jgi:hypothetical protein
MRTAFVRTGGFLFGSHELWLLDPRRLTLRTIGHSTFQTSTPNKTNPRNLSKSLIVQETHPYSYAIPEVGCCRLPPIHPHLLDFSLPLYLTIATSEEVLSYTVEGSEEPVEFSVYTSFRFMFTEVIRKSVHHHLEECYALCELNHKTIGALTIILVDWPLQDSDWFPQKTQLLFRIPLRSADYQ